MEAARQILERARRVTVLTGAGISTDSGIPDFRGPNGVWTKDPAAERTSSLSDYLADGEVRRKAWHNRLDSPAWRASPNAGHMALVQLERRGRLRALVTQNIDGLHQRAGSNPSLVLELHGSSLVLSAGTAERVPRWLSNSSGCAVGTRIPTVSAAGESLSLPPSVLASLLMRR